LPFLPPPFFFLDFTSTGYTWTWAAAKRGGAQHTAPCPPSPTQTRLARNLMFTPRQFCSRTTKRNFLSAHI
jgi:hypothetical protein